VLEKEPHIRSTAAMAGPGPPAWLHDGFRLQLLFELDEGLVGMCVVAHLLVLVLAMVLLLGGGGASPRKYVMHHMSCSISSTYPTGLSWGCRKGRTGGPIAVPSVDLKVATQPFSWHRRHRDICPVQVPPTREVHVNGMIGVPEVVGHLHARVGAIAWSSDDP
jgi:hypothetical protein